MYRILIELIKLYNKTINFCKIYGGVTENALGLCHVLARPCPKPQPQIWDLSPDMRDQWEIDRSEIQLIRKLGQGNFGEVWYGKYHCTFS